MEDSEIEEAYVYVEFEDSVNIEGFKNIHILGIDTKNPIIQLDDAFFKGTFENPFGTYMFFEEDPIEKKSDPLFERSPEISLKYLTKTRKCIKAEHIYVKQKYGSEQEQKNDKFEEDIKPVTFSSLAEAVDMFKQELSSSSEDVQSSCNPQQS
ncbi:general transcription factor 3C polypeptide 6 [Leptidea sinapis]|uniref:Transcription factor TFIIIC triple barrel domain-containing protein n=1 Tax=Leptidea sinapis TaxID=189913 RepID=A0A5E4R146_9NEOP|nr:general transcription factor 3C polypeptide 6 [Leptidea sinapis]VVD03648.1 unnamed protein product [Leptidea sinapis]